MHWTALWVLSVVWALATNAAPSPGGPASQCGWPYMFAGAPDMAPASVAIAQSLLGAALDIQITPDGNFDSNLTKFVKEFQARAGVEQDGWIGPDTWGALSKQTTPISQAGAQRQQVLAVQAGLSFNGFATPLTGAYDNATISSVQAFEKSRGEQSTSGTVVSQHLLHLLVTGCNGTGVFWFDFGWPQGSQSLETFQCLVEQGFRFGTFECWIEGVAAQDPNGLFWPECVQNIANAWAAGLESVGVYMFPQRIGDPVLQAQMLMANLSLNSVVYSAVMLDIEGSPWEKYSQKENRDFISAIRKTLNSAGVNVTVYCGREWPTYFGHDFHDFADVPLIYAHYDNIPSYYDFYPAYGGWTRPAGKQFWDGSQGESVCGTGALDWDWSEKRFW
jgi:peptidoglycan hydrolase-like protein with peptidoglycan-binding domain